MSEYGESEYTPAPISSQLESIVKQTEENLYGRPRMRAGSSLNNTEGCINEKVITYPLNLGNFISKPRSRQQMYIQAKEENYLDEQFRKDVIKNIGILDDRVDKETEYLKDEVITLKAAVQMLTQRLQNTRTEYEVFERSSKEFIHEKALEIEARHKNYEDKVQIQIDNRLEDYEAEMEKFSQGLKELEQIRNLIDPTIEEEIERINKIYELKLENIITKVERISSKAQENEKSLDEILNKYQVEIEAMKKDFIKTTEIQNKRIQGVFDEQNDILKDFDSDLNNLEQRFKNYEVDQIKQVEESMKTVNNMVVDTKEIINSHNEKLNSQFVTLDSRRTKQEASFTAQVEDLQKQIFDLKNETSIGDEFKDRVKEEIKTIKELASIVNLLDQERIHDGKILDELRHKVKLNEQTTKERFNKVEVIIKNNDQVLEEYFKEMDENLDQFKNASITDFESLNKRLVKISNILNDISMQQNEQERQIEAILKQIRPKFEYARKDITSPLTSTMQGILESGTRFSPYRPQRQSVEESQPSAREIINNMREPISVERRQREVSPNVEEIMQKDRRSKRKLDMLKSDKRMKSEIVLDEVQDFSSHPGSQRHDTDLTFRKSKRPSRQVDDDLVVEDLTRRTKPKSRLNDYDLSHDKVEDLTKRASIKTKQEELKGEDLTRQKPSTRRQEQVEKFNPSEFSQSRIGSPSLDNFRSVSPNMSSHMQTSVTLVGPQDDDDDSLYEEDEEDESESEELQSQTIQSVDKEHKDSDTDFDYVEDVKKPSGRGNSGNEYRGISFGIKK